MPKCAACGRPASDDDVLRQDRLRIEDALDDVLSDFHVDLTLSRAIMAVVTPPTPERSRP